MGFIADVLKHEDIRRLFSWEWYPECLYTLAMTDYLSKENNLPELAYETVRVEIDLSDNVYSANDFEIMVAKRDCMSQVVNL